MKKEYLIGALVSIVAVAGVVYLAYRQPAITDTGNKIQVAASFYPLYFFATQIGGDKVAVTNITPSGAEPHDYEPSTQDIARIESGNMLILNGSVEAWGDKLRTQLAGSKVAVVVAGQGLLTKQLTEEGTTMSDPHVWLNPALAKQEAHTIAQGLANIDPIDAAYFTANEAALDSKLDALDADYKAGLARCVRKDIITSHAAFAYLAERYGLNQVAIAGLSPDEEPSAAQLATVADFAKKNGVKYIFFEGLVSPKLSQTIANEVGAQTLVLDPLEGISDTDQTAGKDYFTVMEGNLKNLELALQCTA